MHLEQLLWKVFNFAEMYTFALVWIVVPLSFITTFIWLRKVSVPVEVSRPVNPTPAELPFATPAPLSEPKVNTNEANA